MSIPAIWTAQVASRNEESHAVVVTMCGRRRGGSRVRPTPTILRGKVPAAVGTVRRSFDMLDFDPAPQVSARATEWDTAYRSLAGLLFGEEPSLLLRSLSAPSVRPCGAAVAIGLKVRKSTSGHEPSSPNARSETVMAR